MKTIRASACPRVMQCPASAYLSDDEIAIDEASDAAKLGTAVHAIAKDIVERGLTVGPQVEPYAERYGVTDLTELRVLTAYVRQAWFGTDGKVGLRTYFPNPLVEYKMSTIICDEDGNPELTLTGTMDLGQWALSEARVGDYKSGRKEDIGQYADQTQGYGKLMRDNPPSGFDVDVFKVFPIWLRDKYWDVKEYTGAELDEWSIRLRDKLREGPNSYCTGDHCHFCPKRYGCKARDLVFQQTIKSFAPGVTADSIVALINRGEEVPAELMLSMMEMSKQLVKCVGSWNDQLKQSIKDNGPIKLDNGQTIDLKEKAGKKIIDPEASFDVIANYLNWKDFMVAVTIGKGKLETAIKATVKKGKGKLVEQVFAELDVAGAISQGNPSYSLSVTKAPNGTKQIETTTTTQEEM